MSKFELVFFEAESKRRIGDFEASNTLLEQLEGHLENPGPNLNHTCDLSSDLADQEALVRLLKGRNYFGLKEYQKAEESLEVRPTCPHFHASTHR